MRKVIDYISNIVTTGVVIVSFSVLSQYLFLCAMPFSYFVDFEWIKPSKSTFTETEDIVLISSKEIKRETGFHATHNLFCNTDGEEFIFYSSQQNHFESTRVTEGFVQQSFTFAQHKPKPPRGCFVQSEIVLSLPFGITKDYEYTGAVFTIE